MFVIYPAIDLRCGKVVRLAQGDPRRQTDYGDDPLAAAERWVAQGASFIHMVNLDGAFGEGGEENRAAVARVASASAGRVKIQLGGGLRSAAQIAAALAAGVSRVVLGTAAVENTELVRQAIAQWGDQRIAVGIDVREGRVRSRGWAVDAGVSPAALAQAMAALGLRTMIVTNIACDGVQSGPDIALAQEVAAAGGLEVIASGGVATLAHIAAVREAGLAGVIVGRALYEENFTLAEALAVGQGRGLMAEVETP